MVRFWAALLLFAFSALDAQAFTLNVITNTAGAEQGQQLVSAVPFDNQVLSASPPAVTLVFSEPVRPDKSHVKVLDMYGTRIDDGTLDSTGKNLTVQLPALAPGKYTVKWSARCRCGDDSDISDTFHFSIR